MKLDQQKFTNVIKKQSHPELCILNKNTNLPKHIKILLRIIVWTPQRFPVWVPCFEQGSSPTSSHLVLLRRRKLFEGQKWKQIVQKATIHQSFPRPGNVCILASAPMCFCEFPSRCRCRCPAGFPSGTSEENQSQVTIRITLIQAEP